jgi:tetraacyldisaccharide 4'-kinase
LERGTFDNRVGRAASKFWEHWADPIRPVLLPRDAGVIGVGGVHLGGDGKTPVAISLARELSRRGARVAVVGRSYPRAPKSVRMVRGDDSVAAVGDEPLMMARELAADAVPVFVGKNRSDVLCAAANAASLLIVDGLLQTSPARLALSILVHTASPGGGGRCPPAGDVRASPERLFNAADVILECGAGRELRDGEPHVMWWQSELVGATGPAGQSCPLRALVTERVGVVLAIARPERVVQALEAAGLRPQSIELLPDHATPRAAGSPLGVRAVDLWLTTAKCASKKGRLYKGAPVWTLKHRANLPPELIDLAAQRAGEVTFQKTVLESAP